MCIQEIIIVHFSSANCISYVCSTEHYTELNNYVVSCIITGIKLL